MPHTEDGYLFYIATGLQARMHVTVATMALELKMLRCSANQCYEAHGADAVLRLARQIARPALEERGRLPGSSISNARLRVWLGAPGTTMDYGVREPILNRPRLQRAIIVAGQDGAALLLRLQK